MKRSIVLAAVLVSALALATGCTSKTAGTSKTGTTGSSGGSGAAASPQPTKPDAFAEIPASGAGEKAALAAVPSVVKYATEWHAQQKTPMTDLSAGKPRLVAYLLRADIGSQIGLFEVHADGAAYGMYGVFGQPVDPAKLFWQEAVPGDGAVLVEPSSEREKAAVAAVTALVEKAKPGSKATIRIKGYRFVWIGSDGQPIKMSTGQIYSIEVTPDGNPISWN